MLPTQLYPEIRVKLDEALKQEIPEDRKNILQPLIDFVQQQIDAEKPVRLNFICTHNSRRSQFGQVWAHTVSDYFGIQTECFSGGTEVTAFHQNALEALKRSGFKIEKGTGENPQIAIDFSPNSKPIIGYSKLYDCEENPSDNFAAVMTCSHADENCPYIPGCTARIALDYKDPKEFDNTSKVMEKYEERSDQIAAEMMYVFKSIK